MGASRYFVNECQNSGTYLQGIYFFKIYGKIYRNMVIYIHKMQEVFMGEVKWTKEQALAINEKGENILVAAAAGSRENSCTC